MLGALPGAFGREREQKALPRRELVSKPRDRSRPLVAIDRSAAPTAENGSQRTVKQGILPTQCTSSSSAHFANSPMTKSQFEVCGSKMTTAFAGIGCATTARQRKKASTFAASRARAQAPAGCPSKAGMWASGGRGFRV
jgi:hypothetical protein